ncbi:beta strand repeat-containing protein [Mesorhizobium sp. B4-1-4]|uniref:beta strand repeat-containing protein n=1 Tax=Mesorhizobium sp. B4-1-4 TaxID=2589888 RepID=UPI00112B2A53|nr:hypothetical protein [Mesorhizobium sp. B4-1-4]UCI33502.1 hypothetical protein FJW03_08780 [Mesorhizobium sp. B4-1-4]
MSITIFGKVIEDENLGLTTLATDSDATDSDDNVTLYTFQTNISSPLGDRLTALGIYPDTTTASGTTKAIGISEDTTIVSTTDQNLRFTDGSGLALNGVDSGSKAIDGNEIFLYSDSNLDIVLGREGNVDGADPNGTVAFALLLQPTSSGATIWVVQYEALTNKNPTASEDLNTLNLSDHVYVSGSSSSTTTTSFNIGTKKPGQNYWLSFTSSDGTAKVLMTGLDTSTSSPDTVNTSSVGDGSNTQSITPGGALRFDFVSSFSGGSTKDKAFLTDGSLNTLAYTEGTGASFDISQVTPTGRSVNVQIIAQNETSTTTPFGSTETSTSTNLVALGDIQVYRGTTLLADSAIAGAQNGITFGGPPSAPNGIVNGLTVGEKVRFTSLSGAQFDQFVVVNTNPPKGAGFDILNVTQTQTTTTPTTETQEVGSHIIFEDSVPTASTSTVAKTVYEDGLVALDDPTSATTGTGSVSTLFNPGVDKPLTYGLSSDTSSLTSQNLESGGHALSYSVDTTTDTLTASYTVGAATTTVFTLALTENGANAGDFTFTLDAPVDHAPGASDSKSTEIDFGSIVQATDADGSTATAALAALTVTVVDDVPENFTPVPIASADNIQDAAGSTATKNLTGGANDPYSALNIDDHAGADGFGALTFTGTNGSQLTGQLDSGATGTPLTTADGSAIYLFGFGTGTLTATTDSTGVNAADDVFTITTDPANNQYTFDMLQAIGNGSHTLFSDFADVPAGDYAWFSLPFNPTTKQPVTPGMSVVFTGKTAGTDTVNPSSIGTGTDAQSVKDGNAIRIDFVNDVHSINTTNDLKSLGTLGYAGHYEVNDSGFTLAQVNGSGGPNATVDIRLDAYDVVQGPLAQGGTFPSDSGQDAITEVKLVTFDSSGNETVLADFTGTGTKSITSGGKTESVTFNFAPTGDVKGVDVEGLKYIPGVYILASTADGFDRLVATNVDTTYNNANHSFDVGPVSAGTFIAGSDVNMAFNLALQDYDAYSSGTNLQSGSLVEASTGTLNINLTAPTV